MSNRIFTRLWRPMAFACTLVAPALLASASVALADRDRAAAPRRRRGERDAALNEITGWN